MNKINSPKKKGENTSPLLNLLLLAGVTDNKYLSKRKSGQPSRYLLAFFVPKFWIASQAIQDKVQHTLTHFTGLNCHIMPALANSYGGVTLQNIKAIGKYARRFLLRPRVNPATLLRKYRSKVVSTQNVKGGYHA